MHYRTIMAAGVAIGALGLHLGTAMAQSAAPADSSAVPASPAAEAPAPPAGYTPPKAGAGDSASPAPAVTTDAAAAAPAGDDDAKAAASSLTTAIEDVQVVGPWTDGAKTGVWRTIMTQVGTPEREIYRFFVQRIDKTEPSAPAIVATTEITEIPKINGAVVGYRADEPSEDDTSGLTLFFDIVPSDGEIAETYELHFLKDQPYRFGPATN